MSHTTQSRVLLYLRIMFLPSIGLKPLASWFFPRSKEDKRSLSPGRRDKGEKRWPFLNLLMGQKNKAWLIYVKCRRRQDKISPTFSYCYPTSNGMQRLVEQAPSVLCRLRWLDDDRHVDSISLKGRLRIELSPANIWNLTMQATMSNNAILQFAERLYIWEVCLLSQFDFVKFFALFVGLKADFRPAAARQINLHLFRK